MVPIVAAIIDASASSFVFIGLVLISLANRFIRRLSGGNIRHVLCWELGWKTLGFARIFLRRGCISGVSVMDSGRKRSIADMTDMGWDLKLPIAHRPTAGGTPTGRDSRDGYPTLHIPGRLGCTNGLGEFHGLQCFLWGTSNKSVQKNTF
jgi:hypothetical protein